ncbi:MAG TPA: GtrA family protein [Candidatus Eremiobacteraceae bacterium]|nr:GtrA family protein [Candidatus Eremiobacteraceae bacterium]
MSLAGRLTARRGVRQFVKFAIVGLSGAVVSFIAFHILLHFHLDLRLAFSIGFILGGVNNYWWNRLWTFRSSGHMGKELAQFLTVSAIALVLGILITGELDKHLGAFALRNSLIWLCGTVGGMGVNFFFNKYWTFRHTHRPAEHQA